jgi:UDP-2,4-diacetamido-2,4,6-trideoxy-beta-L-altropyranose hydrolase
MGGSDPDDLTQHALRALARTGVEGLEVTVVVGGSNPRGPRLEQMAREMRLRTRLLADVRGMPGLMAQTDLVMIAAGGTLWEVLYMRCAVLSYARNRVQGAILESLQAKGALVAFPTGVPSEQCVAETVRGAMQSEQWRSRLSQAAGCLVDGRGAERVVRAMRGEEMPE